MDLINKKIRYLPKKDKGSGPYEELFQEGVSRLQDLSKNHWTDYNEHDPGVTILENLCYTLTDMLNKNETAVENVLTEGKGQALTSGDNSLFVDRDILTTNPVTPKDLSRVLMDSVHNVKNVWVIPLKNELQQLDGCYRIEVQPYDYPEPSDPEFGYKIAELPNRIRAVFHQHRNLCEQLAEVVLLRPLELKLKMTLSLVEHINGERALANVFYDLQNHIAKTIDFFSLSHELNRLDHSDGFKVDTPLNQIFNGPALTHGFVPEDELEPRTKYIDLRDLMRKVTETTHQHVDGLHHSVLGIDAFQLFAKSDQGWEALKGMEGQMLIPVPEDRVPELTINYSLPGELRFRQAEIDYKADLTEVRKQLTYRQGQEYGNFRSVADSKKTTGIPAGKNDQIATYFSIREQFPSIYGVGSYGLSGEESEQRYAQAWQLKGYLLPFDQLMTNGLAQLRHLYQMFDMKGKAAPSYTYQVLDDADQLEPLIEKQFHDADPMPKNWESVLEQLNEQHDPRRMKRQHGVANHLLARFNESFSRYVLRNINTKSYGKALKEEAFESELLNLKRRFLSQYADLSYHRLKAKNLWAREEEIPRLVQKIGLLLGIENTERRMLHRKVSEAGLVQEESQEVSDLMLPYQDRLFAKEELDLEALKALEDLESEDTRLQETVFFTGDSDRLLDTVVSRGLLLDNYTIHHNAKAAAKPYFVTLQIGEQPGDRQLIHMAATEEEAELARDTMQSKLWDLSHESEGVYLLEHLALTPPMQLTRFGFQFKIEPNTSHCLEFKHTELKTYAARWKTLDRIIQLPLNKQHHIFVPHEADGKNFVAIVDDQEAILAKAIVDNSDQAQQFAKQLIQKLEALPSEDATLTELITESSGTTQVGGETIPDDFFAYRMSFIMPSWPARFQRYKFKTQFRRLVQEHAPAHVAADTLWLPYEQMREFEELYAQWQALPPYVPAEVGAEQAAETTDVTAQRDECTLALIRFLQQIRSSY